MHSVNNRWIIQIKQSVKLGSKANMATTKFDSIIDLQKDLSTNKLLICEAEITCRDWKFNITILMREKDVVTKLVAVTSW